MNSRESTKAKCGENDMNFDGRIFLKISCFVYNSQYTFILLHNHAIIIKIVYKLCHSMHSNCTLQREKNNKKISRGPHEVSKGIAHVIMGIRQSRETTLLTMLWMIVLSLVPVQDQL